MAGGARLGLARSGAARLGAARRGAARQARNQIKKEDENARIKTQTNHTIKLQMF